VKAEGSDDQHKKSLKEKLKIIFKGKDPVLQAVLFENAITLTSTLVPMISSGLIVYLI
jgi:zinc transporter 9